MANLTMHRSGRDYQAELDGWWLVVAVGGWLSSCYNTSLLVCQLVRSRTNLGSPGSGKRLQDLG